MSGVLDSPAPPPGFAASVARPLRRAGLAQALAQALAPRAPSAPGSPAEAKGARARPDAARRSGRVLLAEDNKVNQRLALFQLERLGIEADVCGNGLSAVAAADAREYALVLMDCEMPGMDGFDATREIRAREAPGRRVPVVAMTAHSSEVERERCLAAGMDDFLSKPIALETLEAAVARWWPRDGVPRGDGPASS